MKTSKTPYEIRLDLLRLAYDILHGKEYAAAAAADGHADRAKAPTTDEIVAEAEKLNGFVSRQNGDK